MVYSINKNFQKFKKKLKKMIHKTNLQKQKNFQLKNTKRKQRIIKIF